MNSRQRILTALNHCESDCVPVDFSGHRSSGISGMAYARLRDFLGLEKRPVRIYDPVQQLAVVDADVLDRFGIDTIELGRAFALEDEHWADWVLSDGTPCQMPVWATPTRQDGEWVLRSPGGRVLGWMPDGAWFFEQTHYPLADEPDLSRMDEAFEECLWTGMASPPGPLVAGPDGERLLAETAQKFRRQTDRAIIALFGGNLLEIGNYFFRNDNFLMMLAGEPGRAHQFLDRLTETHLANLERFLRAVGDNIDIILFGDDLGMQTGPQMSRAMYREFFKPREKLLWQRAKELVDAKVMLHCCGGVRELLPDLIEIGLDAINPVQITCRGMEPGALKNDFGKQLTFWGGGCDTQQVLCNGTPAQVRDHVRRQMDIWRPGGGYVFQQVHNIMADVPAANIVAMFDAVRE
jgi:uroporphyrinogen decarboxylase